MADLDFGSIRQRSIQEVTSTGLLGPPEHLPLLDAPTGPPSTEAIVSRLAVVSGVAAVAFGYPRELAASWLEREGIAGEISPNEARFLDRGDLSDEQGRPEAIFVLAWALGLVSSRPGLSTPCPEALVHHVPRPPRQQRHTNEMSVAAGLAAAQPHPIEDVVRLLDVLYCAHWSVVEGSLRGQEPTLPIPNWAVAERRRAAEWLTYGEAWDEVDLST